MISDSWLKNSLLTDLSYHSLVPIITAYIALGSNLGDRPGHLRAAAAAIEKHPALKLISQSRVYETAPVGGPAGQGAFLNAVLKLETELTAGSLLELLLAIERSRGRERLTHWGPRTLDLDLLIYGDEIIREPGLTVPHPGLSHRAFVLAPLSELAPELVIPGLGTTVREMLSKVDCTEVWATRLQF